MIFIDFMVGAQGLEPWTRGLVSSSNLLNYLSISLCCLNACGENIMLFCNTRIFVPEDPAGEVRVLVMDGDGPK